MLKSARINVTHGSCIFVGECVSECDACLLSQEFKVKVSWTSNLLSIIYLVNWLFLFFMLVKCQLSSIRVNSEGNVDLFELKFISSIC